MFGITSRPHAFPIAAVPIADITILELHAYKQLSPSPTRLERNEGGPGTIEIVKLHEGLHSDDFGTDCRL